MAMIYIRGSSLDTDVSVRRKGYQDAEPATASMVCLRALHTRLMSCALPWTLKFPSCWSMMHVFLLGVYLLLYLAKGMSSGEVVILMHLVALIGTIDVFEGAN